MRVSLHSVYRFLKIGSAFFLIALSLWALFLPPMFPASARALVNARAMAIAVHDPGIYRNQGMEEGTSVHTGLHIARIERNQRAMQKELDDLTFARERLEGQLKHLEENLEFRRADLAQKEKDLAVLRTEALQTLRDRHRDAVDRVDIFEQDLEVKAEAENQLSALLKDGIITSAQWNQARAHTLETRKILHSAREERGRLQRELNQAETSLWAGESSVGENLIAAIETHRQEIQKQERQELEWKVQMRSIEHQMVAAQEYLRADRSFDISSPVDGIIWRKNVLNGQSVLQGESIMQIAIKDSIFVEAYFGRHFLDSISLGDHAHIYLISDARFVHGTIRQIQAQEQSQTEHNVIRSVAPDATMLKVLIEVDGDTLDTRHIGQLAKVMVSRSQPGLIKRVMVWLSLMLRSHQ